MTKIEGKQRRAVLKNFDDILKETNEPYSSILKILFIASNFNKTFDMMQTKELRELIVKRYEISPKKQDKNRYPLLLRLKKELTKYSDIHTDQDIEPLKSLTKSTSDDYKRFESYLNRLEKKGLIERPEQGYCQISNKFMFKPLKKWCSDVILGCPIDKSATWWNSIIFLPNISINEFKDKEVIELKGLLHQSQECYSKITNFLRKIGFRRANEIWANFLNNISCLEITKFYYWLKLIEYNYVGGIKPLFYLKRKEKNKKNMNKEIKDFMIGTDILDELRHESFEALVEKFSTDDLLDWKNKFCKVLDQSFIDYVGKIHSFSDLNDLKKRFINETNKYDKKFDIIKEEIFHIMLKTEFSIVILLPDFLRHKSLEMLGVCTKEAFEIDQAIRYMYNRHPFIENFWSATMRQTKKQRKDLEQNDEIRKLFNERPKEKKNFEKWLKKFSELTQKQREIDATEKPSFFEKTDFFKMFENNLKKLGYINNSELYADLRVLANSFSCPINDSSIL